MKREKFPIQREVSYKEGRFPRKKREISEETKRFPLRKERFVMEKKESFRKKKKGF